MGASAAKKQDESLFLRPLKTKVRRFRTVAYDLETKHEQTQEKGFNRPFLGWVFDGEEHQSFRQANHLRYQSWKDAPWLSRDGIIDKMMRHLLGLDMCGICERMNETALADPTVKFRLCPECKHKRERYQTKHARIYAHNAGRFDALFIVPWLLRNVDRFEFEISGPESRIQRLVIWPRGRDRKRISWTFLDSVSILPMSLKAAGETFLGKKERKIELDLDLPEDDFAWDAYNKRDCEVLYGAVEALNDQIIALGAEVGITAPSTAMSLFRRVFLKAPVRRNKHFAKCDGYKKDRKGERILDDDENYVVCHACAHDFVREGYYGGRTELFEEYGSDVRYFDLNSSYPRSMKEMMPTGMMTEVGPVQDEGVYANLRKSRIGFIECEVEIPDSCVLPPLPVRLDGKLKFTKGRFRGIWDYDELQLLKHPRVGGRIVQYFRSVWYEQRPIFREMIDKLYGMRLDAKKVGNAALDFLMKLMMNSCYGKLGMRTERGALIVHRLGDAPPINGRPLGDPDETGVYEVPRVIDAPYVVPQIAAKVTSNSRIMLFLGMMSVLDQGVVSVKYETDEGIPKVARELGYLSVVEATDPTPANEVVDYKKVAPPSPLTMAPANSNDARGVPYSPDLFGLEGTKIRVRASTTSKDNVCTTKYQDFEWSEVERVDTGRVLYVDTDSIMCVNAIVQPEGNLLGDWKREYPKVLLDGTFVLPKLYQLRKHDPDCQDHEKCPGCRWTLVIDDLELDDPRLKIEEYIDVPANDRDRLEELRLVGKSSADNIRVKLEQPSVERMKGMSSRKQNAQTFKEVTPLRFGGEAKEMWMDKEMFTQHRVMFREGLEGPRTYAGIPGDRERIVRLGLDARIEDVELLTRVVDALNSGKPAKVAQAVAALEKAGLKAVAADVAEAEKYRARFKAIRSTYDKRRLVGGGRTEAWKVEIVDDKMQIAAGQQHAAFEPEDPLFAAMETRSPSR